jgi:polyhydroxyalkanoate synthesis regulator phasin
MGDQVTKKDIESLQTKIDALVKRLDTFADTYAKDKSGTFKAILEGDKVAESKMEPLRKAIADLTKRVAELE